MPQRASGPLSEAFARVAAERAGELALWSRGEELRLTFGALAARVADWERTLDLPAGLPVGLATGNVAAFPELFLALRRRGVPIVNIDGTLPPGDKLALCERLGISILLHRGDSGEAIGAGVRRTTIPVAEPTLPPPGTALVKLTSGSTGEPLGACLTEEALLAGIGQIAAGMEITAADRVLIAIPLSHSYGFDNGVLSLAVLGTPLVLEPGYFPGSLLTALAEGEVTFFPTVPPLVRTLGQQRWPAGPLPLRRVICAGAPLHADAATAFHRASGRHVHQFYGSTESGGISFERDPADPEAACTVGRPLPGVEITLDDDGRVSIASAANFCGHFGRDREAAPRTVVTGDRASWAPGGRLRLLGRNSDILNVGGRKIPVLQVEDALRRLAGVEDAAVVGVEDQARGDRIVAFVVATRPDIDLTGLPPGLLPREVRRLDALPFNERGKVDRGRLRQLASEP